MNNLKITGLLISDPSYDETTDGKIVSFTLRHQPRDGELDFFTHVTCEYNNPPPAFWRSPTLRQGLLVRVEGPIRLGTFKRKEGSEGPAIYCSITKMKEFTPLASRSEYRDATIRTGRLS